ncbi:MAG TPA: glycosyltransferase [Thermoanaerobaculia bacterium]|nr:glycosyltransferase [Thermoanaerobaculia bacterium]
MPVRLNSGQDFNVPFAGSTRGARLSWWLAFALFVAFLVLPGPDRTPFSGLPMALKTQALFFPLLVLALFCLLFPPRRRVPAGWLLVLAVLAVLKLVLAPMTFEAGWKGRYWWVKTWRAAESHLTLQRFYQDQETRFYRIDRNLAFTRALFGLQFVNSPPPDAFVEYDVLARDVAYPLRVEWTGYVRPGAARTARIAAAGTVTIDVDGTRVFHATNPENASVPMPQLAKSGTHVIRVTYEKPRDVAPAFVMSGLDDVVVLPADRFDDWSRAGAAKAAIVALGFLSLLVLMRAFLIAYRPVTHLFLEDIWKRHSKVAVTAIVALFLLLGFKNNLTERQRTEPMQMGNDFLTYEAQARMVLFNGILMVNDDGLGLPYFHYPLYPYGLAASHALLGEDFGTIPMFNAICIAAFFPVFWSILRRRITEGALVAVLAVLTVLALRYLWGYTPTAFSDNLYVPLVFATLAAFIAAMERPAWWRFAVTGALTALGAATRPSFLIFVAFALGAIVLQKRIGSFRTRVRGAVAYVFGFGVAVSPFTLRNWIVSRRFVLLVQSFMMVPMFMFAPESTEPLPSMYRPNGDPIGAVDSVRLVLQILIEHPLAVLWLEIRKILFTLGVTFVGPPSIPSPATLWVLPIAFVFALRTRRVPWAIRTAVLAFAFSHLVAVVIATPWTYGYKTILPLHLALILGIAFLLPKWDATRVMEAPERPRIEPKRAPRVSVVLPTYNEKDSIRPVIEDFFATGVADEVIVVNNNAAAGTSEEVAGTGAIEIFESEQGYGAACQRGLREATGDYIVLCEPDGTFEARDIHKLLAYADDFDVVFGSRTSQQFVWRGANMGLFLRAGNWAVAKYMEFLFNGPNLTDVGCTMRLITRDFAQELAQQFRIKGSQFGPEMMALALRRSNRYRVVQVPVNYKPRVGVSSVTGDPGKAFWLGLQMIWLITRHAIAAAADETQPLGDGHGNASHSAS